MNKRGQNEGVGLGTLLAIVLGVFGVILVILFVNNSFGYFNKFFDSAPLQSLEVVVQGCTVSAQQEFNADFCNTFKHVEIDGVKQYATCSFASINSKVEGSGDVTCTDTPEKVALSYCLGGKIKVSNFDKTLVNGQTCNKNLGFEGGVCPNGKIKLLCSNTELDVTKFVNKLDANNKCCIDKA